MDRQQGEADGFTLIEILVSLVILIVSFGAFFELFTGGLRSAERATAQRTAALLAQSTLARTGTELALVDGETNGVFVNGFRWRLMVSPFEDSSTSGALPLSAHNVSVTVSWGQPERERSVTLTTLRLARRG